MSGDSEVRYLAVDRNAEILIVLYKEVGAHLRATDDKRDHLLNIYLTIILGVISGLIVFRVRTSNYSGDVLSLALLLFLVLLAFGETVFFAMVGARKWHAEYVNCSILLQSMLSRGSCDISPSLVPIRLRHPFIGAIHTSRAFIIVQVVIAGTLFMAANLLATAIGCAAYAMVGALAVVIIITNAILANRILTQAGRRFWENPKNCWCLCGLAFQKTNKEE